MKHQRGTTNVTVRPVIRRGKTVYRVRFWREGKLCRLSFRSKKSADAKAAKLRMHSSHADRAWELLPQNIRERLMNEYEQKSKLVSPSLSNVIPELRKAKLSAGRSERYADNLGTILNQFARGRESIKIDAIALSDVETFLDANSLASRSTLRSRLATLFKFSIRRGYRKDNPCDGLETVTVARKSPAVFTVEQFTSAVEWLQASAPDGLAWFALSSVCGLRPEEAEKTTKADINFKEGFIKVEAQTTKVRRRRVVYPKPEAMAFLKWAVRHGRLPLDSQTRKRILSGVVWKSKDGTKRRPGLRHALCFAAWPKDITRHTAASYWLAGAGETVRHVAKMLGHSEAVCESRYKAVKTQKEAATFWKTVKELAS